MVMMTTEVHAGPGHLKVTRVSISVIARHKIKSVIVF